MFSDACKGKNKSFGQKRTVVDNKVLNCYYESTTQTASSAASPLQPPISLSAKPRDTHLGAFSFCLCRAGIRARDHSLTVVALNRHAAFSEPLA
jgi:hypothetical protein